MVADPPPPPLLGALMRMPLDAVYRRMLEGLHAAGFTDLVAAHLAVLRYPGPHGRRPSELAADLGMTRQAVNYLLGELERLGYLTRAPIPMTGAPGGSASRNGARRCDGRSGRRSPRSRPSSRPSSGRSRSVSCASC